MTRFIFFYEHKLLDGGGGGIRHLDRLVLGSILMMIISSPFLEILWIINTEYTMEIEDVFLCIGYICIILVLFNFCQLQHAGI